MKISNYYTSRRTTRRKIDRGGGDSAVVRPFAVSKHRPESIKIVLARVRGDEGRISERSSDPRRTISNRRRSDVRLGARASSPRACMFVRRFRYYERYVIVAYPIASREHDNITLCNVDKSARSIRRRRSATRTHTRERARSLATEAVIVDRYSYRLFVFPRTDERD